MIIYKMNKCVDNKADSKLIKNPFVCNSATQVRLSLDKDPRKNKGNTSFIKEYQVENGNIHLQYERGYREWTDWLEKHGVKYHHAFMGKPAAVLYIDDKAARVTGDHQDGWDQVWHEVDNLQGRDRYGNLK